MHINGCVVLVIVHSLADKVFARTKHFYRANIIHAKTAKLHKKGVASKVGVVKSKVAAMMLMT